MKKDPYTFEPPSDKARTSWLNPLNYIWNFEAWYSPDLLKLRRTIIDARPELAEQYQAQGSWFAEDETALMNVNQGSWVLPESLEPREQVDRHHFIAPIGTSIWSSLRNLERHVADYLIARNQQKRDTHLNHPINFFLLDVKRVIRIVSNERDPQQVEKVRVGLSAYIRQVINECETLDCNPKDTMFLTDMLKSLSKEVKPDVEAAIKTQSLGKIFDRLRVELNECNARAVGVTHTAYQDGEINPHAMGIEATDDLDLTRHPTHALTDCAKKSATSAEGTALVERHSSLSLHRNPFYQVEKQGVQVKSELLTHCENIQLMEGVSDKSKEEYVGAVAHINTMSSYYEVVERILNLFQEAGHYSTVLHFDEQLNEFLGSLTQELTAAQETLNAVIDGNELLKRALYKEKGQQSYLRIVLNSLKGDDSRSVRIERFLNNQKQLNRLQEIKEGIGGFEKAKKTIEEIKSQLTSLTHKYESQQVKIAMSEFVSHLRADITQIGINHQQLYPNAKPEIGIADHNVKPLTITNSRMGVEQGEPVVPVLTPVNVPVQALPIGQIEASKGGSKTSSFRTVELTCPAVQDRNTGKYEHTCFGGDYKLTLISTENTTALSLYGHELPFTELSLNKETCKYTSFQGVPATYCESEDGKYAVYYQSTKPNLTAALFDQAGAQLMLGACFLQLGKDIYSWAFKKPEVIVPALEKEADTFFQDAYKRIAEVKRLGHDKQWVEQVTEDSYYRLDEMKTLRGKHELSVEAIQECNEDLAYLLDSVTVERPETVKIKVCELQKKLSQESGLSLSQLASLEKYYQALSGQLHLSKVRIPSQLIEDYEELAEGARLSQTALYEVAVNFHAINDLLASEKQVMKSDLIDSSTGLSEISPQLLNKQDDIDVDIEDDLRRLRNKQYHPWQTEDTTASMVDKLPFFALNPPVNIGLSQGITGAYQPPLLF